MPALYFAILVLNLIFSTVGDILAKVSSVTNNYNYFYLGLVFNIVTVTSFMFLIRLGGLAVSTSVVLLMGVIAIILISNVYKVVFIK